MELTGRQVEVAEPLKRLAERKLRKLSKSLPCPIHAHVVLEA